MDTKASDTKNILGENDPMAYNQLESIFWDNWDNWHMSRALPNYLPGSLNSISYGGNWYLSELDEKLDKLKVDLDTLKERLDKIQGKQGEKSEESDEKSGEKVDVGVHDVGISDVICSIS